MTTRIILDTDIGSDIDDALALALALNSPEIELLAVTTVNTDPPMRARLAAKMLATWGRSDIPVAPGERDCFDGSPTFCDDICQAIVLTVDDPPLPDGDGVELIIDTVRANPGEVTLVGIGPWTNIARAFERSDDLAGKVARLVLMGGHVTPPAPEYNVTCDPAAAAYVLNLDVPKLLVPFEVSKVCRYAADRHADLLRAGRARARLVHDFIRAWQIGRRRGDACAEPTLFDPVTIAVAFDATLATRIEPMHLRVDCTDPDAPRTIPTPDAAPNVEVVTDTDKERFDALFAERITG